MNDCGGTLEISRRKTETLSDSESWDNSILRGNITAPVAPVVTSLGPYCMGSVGSCLLNQTWFIRVTLTNPLGSLHCRGQILQSEGYQRALHSRTGKSVSLFSKIRVASHVQIHVGARTEGSHPCVPISTECGLLSLTGQETNSMVPLLHHQKGNAGVALSKSAFLLSPTSRTHGLKRSREMVCLAQAKFCSSLSHRYLS